ncbi:hypothetical protein D3C80_2060270 [compost metagenome]
MSGVPAGIAEGDQAALRAAAVGDGEQHVLRGGKRQVAQFEGRLVVLAGGMQDEAAVGLYRAAAEDVHRLAACRRQFVRAQLFEYVAEA